MDDPLEPDAFANFYRRHAGRLLDELTERVGDTRLAAELCAESFAVALLRSERELDGIAGALVERAGRRGCVEDRARRRLGMAPLEPGESFLRDLEEELVAAAAYLAQRRRRRAPLRLPALPRPPAKAVRAVLTAAGALALAAAVAALAIGDGDGSAPRPAAVPAGSVAELRPMLAPVDCPGLVARERPAAPAMPFFALFQNRRRVDDALPAIVTASLPLATLDPRETRLAANGRRGTRLHAVPSLRISDDASCVADDGPGVCLVDAGSGMYRCFTIADIGAARAFVRTERGSVAGIVPDGIGRVSLSSGTRRASASVSANVYEAELGVPAGTRVGVLVARPGENGCVREVAPGVLARVAALRRPPTERLLPMAALTLLRDREGVGDVVERGARLHDVDHGVEFWVVPVARPRAGECEPARGVCVVAAPDASRPDAECSYGGSSRRPAWLYTPLLHEHGAVLGIVPRGVAGVRVTFEALAAELPARDNVIAGLLSFSYIDSARVELLHGAAPGPPRIGIVDAGGDPAGTRLSLRAAGYDPLPATVPGVKRQPLTAVYWQPRATTLQEAAAVARAAGADVLTRIDGRERTPLPVLQAAAPLVVVVGHGGGW